MGAYGSLITELETAISSGTVERRIESLWHVTELFITGASQYSDDQVALFDDVIGRLAEQIELTARAKLARRLALIPNAPVRIIKTLAFDDEIAVAGPVLTHSQRLAEEVLLAVAGAKSQQHLLAMSARHSLSEAVTDVLVERGDSQVARAVSRNAGARFSDAGFGMLVKRSEGDEVLAEHVGGRADIPRHHFLRLIARASDAVRTKLAAANPAAAEEVQYVITEVVGKIRAEAVLQSGDYDTAMRNVEPLHRARTLAESHVYAFAKARQFEETVVALAFLGGVPIDVVETAMLDERADMTLILAKAAGLSWTTAKFVVLLRASGHGVSAHELEQALQDYERLADETAQRAVRFYQRRRRLAAQAG
jgi:uncharacterized protein (DUF2336 family)